MLPNPKLVKEPVLWGRGEVSSFENIQVEIRVGNVRKIGPRRISGPLSFCMAMGRWIFAPKKDVVEFVSSGTMNHTGNVDWEIGPDGEESMSKRIVLILEECRISREVWGSWLMADGFHVLSTADQRVALGWVRRFRPAFVIANTQLVPIDGFQFCRLLRNHRDTQSIPVALVSESWEKMGRVRAELSGAVVLLESELNRSHFLDVLYDHLLIEEETTGTARERHTYLSLHIY